MEIIAKFNSVEEMEIFAGAIKKVDDITPVNSEKLKETVKDKKNKVAPAEDKKVDDKKEETPKVKVEVTGVDTNTTEPTKDAEIKEENSDDGVEITKEMVREKFNQVVKSGKQKEAKQLIENLGAKKLSDVKPEDYATLIKEAEALL